MYALLAVVASVQLVTCMVVFDKDKHEISSTQLPDGEVGHIVHLKDNVNSWFVKAHYQENFTKLGWDFLHIETNPALADADQAYFAGFIEGHRTHEKIYSYWYNVVRTFCDKKKEFCDQVNRFLDRNLAWMEKTIAPHQKANDPFWHQVQLFNRQMLGLQEGYKHCWERKQEVLSYREFIWINFLTEIETLKSTFNTTDFPVTVEGLTHCSALIKLLPGFQDLLVSHVTWTGYQYMLRMIKRYDFHFRTSLDTKRIIPGESMTFSGYPGVLTSVDDYYVINSGLAVLETTIGNSNNSLWEFVQPTGQVFETVRSMVANRLARDGREWSQVFSQYNNGLYNNQWMVVDMNKFVRGQRPQKDVLWIIEQTPGYIRAEDQTKTLVQQLYWPSYNIPFFPDVFKRMGNEQLVQTYGDWFSYENAPRAKIFRRDQNKVRDVDSMMRLMRSNNYKNDPYSRCNCTPPYSAANAISCRDDLNPKNGTYPFPALGHRNHGAIDAKVTNYDLFKRMQFKAISGPTNGTNLPQFRWSTSDFEHVTHLGQPDEFRFPEVVHVWGEL